MIDFSNVLNLVTMAQTEVEPLANEPVAADGAADSVESVESIVSSQLVDMLGETITQTSIGEWLVLLGGIFGGLLIGRIAQGILRGASRRAESKGWSVRATVLNNLAGPANLSLIALGIAIGLQGPVMADPVRAFALKITGVLYIVAIGWFLFNLVDLVDLGMRRLTSRTPSTLDDQLVPLVRKALRIFLIIVFSLFVAENIFEADIGAWLATLGIAGLAFSLAAQDSIKNLFGSITVILDRPFAVGDRLIFEGHDGTAEEIGFRSTKIRTLAGNLVTIPNMKFIDNNVENISARPSVRRIMNVTITYDTPAEKIEQAVQILKDVLNEPDIADELNLPDQPPRVIFNDLNADSLNIFVIYWYAIKKEGRDWWTYQDHAQRLNLKLFRAYETAGIEFAFPTQTLYLAGDPNRKLDVNVHQSAASN